MPRPARTSLPSQPASGNLQRTLAELDEILAVLRALLQHRSAAMPARPRS